MNKFLKTSCTWALSIISMVFTFLPEASFEGCKLIKDASNEMNVIINRLLTFITIFVIVLIAHAIEGAFA